MSVPPSIKKPLDQGMRFRLEDHRSETRPAIFTPDVTLDLDPRRQFGQAPAYDGLMSRRGGPSPAILRDPRLVPFPQEPPDDFFWQLDARSPWVAFTKPTASLATYLGIPGAEARALYTFEETTGFFNDQVGAAHLTASAAAVSAGQVLFNRVVPGVWNGTDLTSVRTCEFLDAEGTGSSCGSTDTLDPANSSVAMVTVWRSANSDDFTFGGAGKYDAAAGGNTGQGFGFYFDTNDSIVCEVGGGAAGGHFSRTLNSQRDGALHYLVMAFSRASASLNAFSDIEKAGSTASSSIGSLLTTRAFTVGKQHTGITQPYTLRSFTRTGHWQPLWLAVLTGSAAEAIFHASGAMDTWWATVTNRSVPGMSYLRPGPSGQVVGYAAGTGTMCHVYSHGEIEFAYHSGFSHESKLGMAQRGFALTNTLGDSTHVSGAAASWQVTGSSTVVRAVDCPRGFRNGTVVHKTAVSGNAFFSITPNAQNYVSVFVRRSGSAVPRVRVVQTSNGAVQKEVVCSSSLENEWALYKMTFGTAGTSRIELHPSDPNDSSGSACFQYAQFSDISGMTTPSEHLQMPTSPLTNANSNRIITATTTGSVLFDHFGEVDLTYVPLSRHSTTNKTIWTNMRTGSDKREVYLSQSNGNIASEVRGIANNVLQPSINFGANLGTETIVKIAWDHTGSFDLGYTITSSAGTTSSFGPSGSTILSASETARVLDLGSGSAPAGVISLLKVYAKTKIM
jgi:hypothetical protein